MCIRADRIKYSYAAGLESQVLKRLRTEFPKQHMDWICHDGLIVYTLDKEILTYNESDPLRQNVASTLVKILWEEVYKDIRNFY